MTLSIKPRVVLDTNVFISGLVWGGNPGKVLNLWLQEKFILFVSPAILLEILTVLAKFQVPANLISQFKDLLENHAEKVIPRSRFTICRDPKDNQFLNLCFACRADYLVSGDKDLLALKTFKGTKILKPKDFLSLYGSVKHRGGPIDFKKLRQRTIKAWAEHIAKKGLK